MHRRSLRAIMTSFSSVWLLAYTVAVSAAPAARDPRAALDWEAGEEAGKVIDQCIAEHVPGNYLICDGEWRGISYKISSDYKTEILIPSGASASPEIWQISCTQDKMTDKLSCQAFHYVSKYRMSGVAVIQSYNSRAVVWGKEVYPGTTPQVRFGYGEPINVSYRSMFDPAVADRLVEGMRLNDRVLFRYMNWPQNIPVDVEIDTSRYREFEALMGAVFVRYRHYVEG